jgi:hypothetical protein
MVSVGYASNADLGQILPSMFMRSSGIVTCTFDKVQNPKPPRIWYRIKVLRVWLLVPEEFSLLAP